MTAPSTSVDHARFASTIEAARREDDLFEEFYVEPIGEDDISLLRRRRRPVANSLESPIRAVTLVEEDGVLYWRDGVPGRAVGPRRRGRRGGASIGPEGTYVMTREFPALAPNKVIDALGALDRRLNKAVDTSLRSRLRELRQTPDGGFEFQARDAVGPFSGRTLLFVHGTFSNAENMLNEFKFGPRALRFLNRSTRGATKYDQVLFFDHPTLSVSPVMNALELGRLMSGSKGHVDVISHSRGGLLVRWWLEAFGSSLRTGVTPVRAVLTGSPLHGTSLAAPDKIQGAMSLISNIGSFAEKTMSLVGVANPFLWVAGKLVEVIVSVTGALARTPLVDALTALIPGLAAQSAVSNNHELSRLRIGPVAVDPSYYAIKSNFETKNPGWRFWRNFRRDRAGDLAADIVFPAENDLIVDTWSMDDFGVPKLALAGKPCDFGTSETVWHCNYFRQDKAIDYIASAFRMTLD
jgi:pimeloyl-ACP methyl ester carboxylesterase